MHFCARKGIPHKPLLTFVKAKDVFSRKNHFKTISLVGTNKRNTMNQCKNKLVKPIKKWLKKSKQDHQHLLEDVETEVEVQNISEPKINKSVTFKPTITLTEKERILLEEVILVENLKLVGLCW